VRWVAHTIATLAASSEVQLYYLVDLWMRGNNAIGKCIPQKIVVLDVGFTMFTREDTRFFDRTSKILKELVSNSMHEVWIS